MANKNTSTLTKLDDQILIVSLNSPGNHHFLWSESQAEIAIITVVSLMVLKSTVIPFFLLGLQVGRRPPAVLVAVVFFTSTSFC